jgi:hypothetical protein
MAGVMGDGSAAGAGTGDAAAAEALLSELHSTIVQCVGLSQFSAAVFFAEKVVRCTKGQCSAAGECSAVHAQQLRCSSPVLMRIVA